MRVERLLEQHGEGLAPERRALEPLAALERRAHLEHPAQRRPIEAVEIEEVPRFVRAAHRALLMF